MLKVENLTVSVDQEKKLIKQVSFAIPKDSLTLLVGPNGSGKSTLAKALMGFSGLKIGQKTRILLEKKDISKLPLEKRAQKGIFLGYQAPVEIPGVKILDFLRASYNSIHNDKESLDLWEFIDLFNEEAKSLGFPEDLIDRDVNVGFSGGERKRLELLQMLILKPRLAILDELDSGLDVDAIKQMYKRLQKWRKETKNSVLLISHNPKVLEHLDIDAVLLMEEGEIVKEGGVELAEEVFEKGFLKKLGDGGVEELR